jgi:hypothetical protein
MLTAMTNRLTRKQRALRAVEVTLWVLFIIDCFWLAAAALTSGQYEPDGGGSLIVILLVIVGVKRLRHGPGFMDRNPY